MHNLKNDLLNINIKPKGVELCNITSVKNNTEFMWQADSNIWGSHAPNLFPVIGSMKDDCYIYEDETYPMTKHGFVRRNDAFSIKNSTETAITFLLTSNDELYKMYPFLFEFAHEIGVSDRTLERWAKKHKEFCRAYKEAKELQKNFLIINGLLGLYKPAFAIFTAKNITDMRNEKSLNLDAAVDKRSGVIVVPEMLKLKEGDNLDRYSDVPKEI